MEDISSDIAFRKKIIHALSLMKKGTAEEIASEIVELDGITSEEAVAETVITVKEHSEKMAQKGLLDVLRSKHAPKRYTLADLNSSQT